MKTDKLLEKYVCRGGTKKCPVPHEPVVEITYRQLKRLVSRVREDSWDNGHKNGYEKARLEYRIVYGGQG